MKRGGGEIDAQYPVLKLSDWMASMLVERSGAPEFLLGGHMLFQTDRYKEMFARFCDHYEPCDPAHPVYAEKSASERATTVPISFHGDEGRGLCKIPVLIEAYQPVIPWMGENCLNVKGPLGNPISLPN